MAEIKFYGNIVGQTGAGSLIDHTNGSGLGFYGSSFGVSVPIGSQQTTTYITNADGTNQGARLNNTAKVTAGDNNSVGTVSSNGVILNLDKLPNYLCPLNIRFTHTEAVKVQNCKLRIYDRNSIANNAVGVTTWVYEARHPSTDANQTSLNHRGRSPFSWQEYDPAMAMQDMNFTSSPGMSGVNTNTSDTNVSLGYLSNAGSLYSSPRHDWYVAISSEPDTIGSKTNYGLYFTVEYL
jgi:hypothetical protein